MVPYGLEEIIQKAGYGRAALILILTPLIWSLPTALMLGELAAALPHEGGYYVWVRRAMGRFWGFQQAWLAMAASIFDMAIYPTLFVLYLRQLFPALDSTSGMMLGAAMIALCAGWNVLGARAVGRSSLWMSIMLLAPFAVLIVAALLYARNHSPEPGLMTFKPIDLVGGIVIAMWNYMGWDNASTVAGEVEHPQRVYPRAMLLAVASVSVIYLTSVAAVAAAGIDPSQWTTGSWAEVGGIVGGHTLRIALVAGGVLCGLGMFNALVMSYSRIPMVLAQDGFLPKVFTKLHPKTGAPWVSICVCSLAWTACLGLGFEQLITLDIMLYGLSLLLQFASLVILRVREPELARPFRVPGGIVGAALLGLGPLVLITVALVQARTEGLTITAAGRDIFVSGLMLGLSIIATGFAVYWVARMRKQIQS